jgi:hypothetical protein
MHPEEKHTEILTLIYLKTIDIKTTQQHSSIMQVGIAWILLCKFVHYHNVVHTVRQRTLGSIPTSFSSTSSKELFKKIVDM